MESNVYQFRKFLEMKTVTISNKNHSLTQVEAILKLTLCRSCMLRTQGKMLMRILIARRIRVGNKHITREFHLNNQEFQQFSQVLIAQLHQVSQQILQQQTKISLIRNLFIQIVEILMIVLCLLMLPAHLAYKIASRNSHPIHLNISLSTNNANVDMNLIFCNNKQMLLSF